MLFNKCVDKSTYPSHFKLARVIPIHKNGDINDVDNYRPISILSSVSKVLERLLFKRITSFFVSFKLFNCNQFGFRQNHCTVDAIGNLVHYLQTAVEKKAKPMGVFLDLKKAFDTVDHKILLAKCEKYGLRGPVLKLLESYLRDRRQLVYINNTRSEIKNVNYGVPQGSILGPLLFLIFINDISDCAVTSKVVLFADDTAVLNNDLQLCLVDTQNVKRWLYDNKLTLNVKKTKVISFGSGICPLNFKIDDEDVEQVCTWKYLGLNLDDKLNFSYHIDAILSNLSKQCGLLYRMRKLFHVKTLVNYYNTYIKSVIQYGVMIYGCTRKALLNPILLLQKRIARVIFFKKPRESVSQIMTDNKMYSVYELHIYELFKEVVKERIDKSNINLLPHQSFTRSTRLSEAKFIRPELYKSNKCDLFLQNRLIKTYNYFNNLKVLDRAPTVIGPAFYNYVHTVLDNIIVDNSDLDSIIFCK